MALIPIAEKLSAQEAVSKLLGDGDWVSKAQERRKLSNTDKFLAASNAASAAIGVGAINTMRRQAGQNIKRTIPGQQAGGLPRTMARGMASGARRAAKKYPSLKPIARAAHGPIRALNRFGSTKTGAAVVGGGLLAGTAFNAVTDAMSTKSIMDKGKVKKRDVTNLRPLRADLNEPLKAKQVRAAGGALTPLVGQAERAAMSKIKGGVAGDKRNFTIEAKVAKALDDKRQVFGWASITEINGEPVVDLQGDYVTIDVIEKAAHKYIQESRQGGDMHRRNGDSPHHVADLIESIVVTPEKKEALGLPEDSPTGWWVGFQVNDDTTWDLVKDGKRPMFSIHGTGKRVEKSL